MPNTMNCNQKRNRVLVIEKLDLVSFIYLKLFSGKSDKIVFFSENSIFKYIIKYINNEKVTRLTFKDFPGTYFDAQKETVLKANDKFFNNTKEDNIFLNFLIKIKENPLTEVALRKEVTRYTFDRVRSYFFLRRIIDGGNEVEFIPVDNVDLSNFIEESAIPDFSIPLFIRTINRFKQFIAGFSAIIYATGAVVLFAFRGILFQRARKERFNVGFDVFDWGISHTKPYHDMFLYGDGIFQKEKVFHVVRNRLENQTSRKYFLENGIPYIEFGKIRPSIKYFVKRIIIEFYLNAMFTTLNVFSKSYKSIFARPAISVAYNIIANEIFYSYYDVKVFIARDEYAVSHIARTLVANENGNKTVGFMHGDDSLPTIATNYLNFDHYCIWGEYYRNLHRKALSFTKNIEIIGAGIYGLDKTYEYIRDGIIPEKYKELKKKYKIITVFGSSFHPDLFITEELTLSFYETVFSLIDKYNDICLVIKPKAEEFDNKKFLKLINGDRIFVDKETWTYELIPISDLIICINCSTVGIEGMMAGKKVLYFDVTNFKEHPYKEYDPHLVSFTEEEFYRNAEWVLKYDKYLSLETLEHIRSCHGFKFDGKVVDRLRNTAQKSINQL